MADLRNGSLVTYIVMKDGAATRVKESLPSKQKVDMGEAKELQIDLSTAGGWSPEGKEGLSISTSAMLFFLRPFQMLVERAEVVVLPRLKSSCSLPSNSSNQPADTPPSHELQAFSFPLPLCCIQFALFVICHPIGSSLY